MTKNINSIPQNINNLQINKFTFVISELPNVSYFCQSVTFPGVATSEFIQETPFSAVYRHGDKLQYDPLVITFLIDEDMRNWEQAYNWFKGLTFPHNHSEYERQKTYRNIYSDCSLTINRNSNTPNLRFKFLRCHPVAMGPITFDTTNDANMVPVGDLTLRYDTFELERINS